MLTIRFQRSEMTLDWTGEHENILEAAEDAGLLLEYGCRVGNCTMCQQPIVSGEVEYPDGHLGEPEEGDELLCCSVPRTNLVIDA